MSNTHAFRFAALLGLGLSACTQQSTSNTTTTNTTTTSTIVEDNSVATAPETNAVAATANACASIPTSDWAAWVDAMPGPGKTPHLIVTGLAHPNSTGYRYRLDQGVLDKSNPPTLHLNLVADGVVTPVVPTSPDKIRGEFAPIMAGATVAIDCEGKQVGSAKVTIAS